MGPGNALALPGCRPCPGKRSALLLQGRIRSQRQKVSNGRQTEPRAIPPPNWKKEQGSEGFLTKKETERRKRARSLKNSDMKRHLDSKMSGNPQPPGQVFPGKAWLQDEVGRRGENWPFHIVSSFWAMFLQDSEILSFVASALS